MVDERSPGEITVSVCLPDHWQINKGSSINGYTVLCSVVCIGVLVGLRYGAD